MKSKKILVFLTLAAVLLLIFTFGFVYGYRANQPEITPQEKTFKFLTENGFSDAQACGIMACIEISSNFNSAAEDLNHTGYGLMFWCNQRREILEQYALMLNKPLDDLEMQLEFLLDELNPESENYQLVAYNGYSPENFWNSTTPEEAALSFCCIYEKPHVDSFEFYKSHRIMLANNYYLAFSN